MKWCESNLIPTVTISGRGGSVHAVIVQRRRIVSLCSYFGSIPTFKYHRDGDFLPPVVLDGLLKWVNCRKCLRVAEREQPAYWIALAPPAFRAQPKHPDRIISEMSNLIIAAGPSDRRDLWLILADYFDDNGDRRGEFIRLQVAIAEKPDPDEHPLRHAQLVNRLWAIEDDAFVARG